MNVRVVEINTDEELLAKLKNTDQKQSAQDTKEQRVSFVYGAMKSDSNITKEAVRKIIAKQEG